MISCSANMRCKRLSCASLPSGANSLGPPRCGNWRDCLLWYNSSSGLSKEIFPSDWWVEAIQYAHFSACFRLIYTNGNTTKHILPENIICFCHTVVLENQKAEQNKWFPHRKAENKFAAMLLLDRGGEEGEKEGREGEGRGRGRGRGGGGRKSLYG